MSIIVNGSKHTPAKRIQNKSKTEIPMRIHARNFASLAQALPVLLLILTGYQPAYAAFLTEPPGIRIGNIFENAYTTTLLSDGKYLVAGGYTDKGVSSRAEIYNPITGLWTNTGSMTTNRVWHKATLLSDGKVLVVGGRSGRDNSDYSSAEIYDPVSGAWTGTGSMNVTRRGSHTVTLLANGKVLVTGGLTNNSLDSVVASTELFDPTTEKWTITNPMNIGRYEHVAISLTNGLVLVAGGKDKSANWIFSAELYNPANGKWTMTGSMPYESRFNYTGMLLANGQVLLSTSDANAWAAGKELYDPSSGQWKVIGQSRPHFVSSTNLSRTLTISPKTGSSFLASEEIQFTVESADRFGVTNLQIFRDNVPIGEGQESPMRYTLTNAASGTYTFLAKAGYANGLASTSSPVNITFTSSKPEVSLAPGPTEFISDIHVKTSPATLLANVVGVNPGSLTQLTLNGVPQPLKTGKFILNPSLSEGENVFVLVATDQQGRTGKATTEIYFDSSIPIILIQEPPNNASINAMCVDVRGTFKEKNLKQIRVNEMPATVSGNTFEARNVFLQSGANTIAAVAENLAGNVTTNIITIIGPTDSITSQTLPVQLKVTPAGGFAPFPVILEVQAHVPGKIQHVYYDFDGDNIPDQINPDLRPVKHTYAAGEFFPVVTIQTEVGRFSSLSGMSAMLASAFGGSVPVIVNAQMPPVLVSTLKIANPVDVKWTAASNLYVLSGNTATIAEFDTRGNLVRALKGIGSNPSGMSVDSNGNVYVAMTGNNQVWKFKPTANAFEADPTFGTGGFIGNKDGSVGANANQFSAPFGVLVSQDGQGITVSDSGNHRIQQFKKDGTFSNSAGGRSQFNHPKGLAHDAVELLFIVDSDNNRVAVWSDDVITDALGTSGTNGAALGQFAGALNLSASVRGLYVADTGNNRVQVFAPVSRGESHSATPFYPRVALSGELGLNHPRSVAVVEDLLEEKFYIADTGNNRVILVKLPSDNPEEVWKNMRARMMAGDVPGAVSYFSIATKDQYQEAFGSLSKDELISDAKDLGPIQPVSVEGNKAQYYFEKVIDGKKLTFPIEFDKEFGRWKVMEY